MNRYISIPPYHIKRCRYFQQQNSEIIYKVINTDNICFLPYFFGSWIEFSYINEVKKPPLFEIDTTSGSVSSILGH